MQQWEEGRLLQCQRRERNARRTGYRETGYRQHGITERGVGQIQREVTERYRDRRPKEKETETVLGEMPVPTGRPAGDGHLNHEHTSTDTASCTSTTS